MAKQITAKYLQGLVEEYIENIANAIEARCKNEYDFTLEEGDTSRPMGWAQMITKQAQNGATQATCTLALNNTVKIINESGEEEEIPKITFNQKSAEEIFAIVKNWWNENVANDYIITLKGSSERYEHSIWFIVDWSEAKEEDKSLSKQLMDAIAEYHQDIKDIYFASFVNKYGTEENPSGAYWLPTLLNEAKNGKNIASLSYDLNSSLEALGEKTQPEIETVKQLLIQWWKEKDSDFMISFDEVATTSDRPELLHFSVTWNK